MTNHGNFRVAYTFLQTQKGFDGRTEKTAYFIDDRKRGSEYFENCRLPNPLSKFVKSVKKVEARGFVPKMTTRKKDKEKGRWLGHLQVIASGLTPVLIG